VETISYVKLLSVFFSLWLAAIPLVKFVSFFKYRRTPLIRINLDGEPSGYVENPDNWNFL